MNKKIEEKEKFEKLSRGSKVTTFFPHFKIKSSEEENNFCCSVGIKKIKQKVTNISKISLNLEEIIFKSSGNNLIPVFMIFEKKIIFWFLAQNLKKKVSVLQPKEAFTFQYYIKNVNDFQDCYQINYHFNYK